MIKAFLGAVAALLAVVGAAGGPATSRPDPRRGFTRASSVTDLLEAEGTNSTPGAFPLPQLGSASFRCDRNWAVQPRFDMHSAVATEGVAIRAVTIARRNFTGTVVGRLHGRPLIGQEHSRAQELALPFGHYRTVTFTVRQGDEAREIDATLTAHFVAGAFAVRGVPGRRGACYVKRWSVRMNVSP
jgi:hypothetical protein